MHAITVSDREAGVAGRSLTDLPCPQAADNEVVVRVHAAGYTAGELDCRHTWSDRAGGDRAPIVPGQELSGAVAELGYGTTGLSLGQRVFGLADRARQDIRREGSHKVALKALFAALITVAMFAPTAHADPARQSSDQTPLVQIVFDQPTNVSGKSLVTVTVSYPPGAKSEAHHHAKSAFIMAYVISGAIRSQLEDEPARVFHTGETWTEAPGAHHTISENASATEPAELLAVFLIDTGDGPLTTNDTEK